MKQIMWVLRDSNSFAHFWPTMSVLDGITKLIHFAKSWAFVMDHVSWGSWSWGRLWKHNLSVTCIEMPFDYAVGLQRCFSFFVRIKTGVWRSNRILQVLYSDELQPEACHFAINWNQILQARSRVIENFFEPLKSTRFSPSFQTMHL